MNSTSQALSFNSSKLFEDNIDAYRDRDWTPLPLPWHAKFPPPTGFTGANRPLPTDKNYEYWRAHNANGNIALRLPPLMFGVDVDHYDDKRGGDTIAAFEALHGPLPPTWKCTSRDDGISGIRLYRMAEPVKLKGELGPWVEIIQHHHRYVVAPPSIHPITKRRYFWYSPDGTRVDVPPHVDEITVV